MSNDEVSQFLEQVERLRDQQIEEDEVRARELEQYLAAKRERQARREERARSISPQKSSPANTPSPRSSRQQSVQFSEALRFDSPRAAADRDGASEDESGSFQRDPDSSAAMAYSSSPTKENEAPSDEDVKRTGTSSPNRGSPLAWQRRPVSRGGARPLSMVAAQNATQRSLAGSQEPPSAPEQSFSRDQIAQTLGSKDPAWFRQTADRGQGSAAYRRNQVEDADRMDMGSLKSQLPGMSTDPVRDQQPSQTGDNDSSHGRLASPLPLNPPKPNISSINVAEETTSPAEINRSPTGRTSPIRSTSPTKGMGGFVQSAMMKRTDSVKRWSVTSPPGLTRSDSVASYRNPPQSTARPQSMARGGATTPGSSRPVSQAFDHGHGPDGTSRPKESHSYTTSKPLEDDAGIPTSPSKTMDSRRWSPTKSSWLENALNRPESPKLQPKAPPPQPAWASDFPKKTERSGSPGTESSRPSSISHRHQVSVGGLMRTSALGEGAKPNTTGLGGIYSPPPGGNRPPMGHGSKPSFSQTASRPTSEIQEDERSLPSEKSITKDESGPPRQESQPKAEPRSKEVTKPKEEIKSRTSAAEVKLKPKPVTPPKKDFRSNLKQRPTESGKANAGEPEFKNVFGNLRRTKTQNYVAPDELKDNILKGKAALSVTNGPQKSEKKDEFKDAILKKKDDFKKAQADGKGVTRSSTTAAEKPVPEGLARRAELGRTTTMAKRSSISETKAQSQTHSKPASPKPVPGPKRISSQSGTGGKSPSSLTASKDAKSAPLSMPRRVSTEPAAKERAPDSQPAPTLHKETSEPSKLQPGRAGGGKLAGRFNPALAGMLARGPPAASTGGGAQASRDARSPEGSGASSHAEKPSAPGPQLTHMTKNRARGPRRKAPTSSSASSTPAMQPSGQSETVKPVPAQISARSSGPPPSPLSSPVEKQAMSRSDRASPVPNPKAAAQPAEPAKPAALSIQQQVAAKATLRGRPAAAPREPDANEQPSTSNSSFARRQPMSPESPVRASPAPLKTQKTGDAPSQAGSPKKLDMNRMSRFLDDGAAPSEPAAPSTEPAKLTHQRTGPRSPVKAQAASPVPLSDSAAKGIKESVPSTKGETPAPAKSSPKSPPTTAPKPLFTRTHENGSPSPQNAKSPRPLPMSPSNGVKSPASAGSPAHSSNKQPSELSTILHDFFGPEQSRKAMKVDTADVLMRRPEAGVKINSHGFQMFQLTGDGKKVPVPAHHERVLFEQEMYICPHDFTDPAGKRTFQVYFWVGDQVPESVAEDAQLFARREARSLGGPVTKLKQGKETSEFIQALGGVAIIRRSSSNKYDSLASNMLCGRRHIGQIVFDEVDFSPASLCAGFPYLITQAGKCFLWKGKGSNVDELSCARLIGMDLTLTGELVEYDDGAEPASFWDMFDGGVGKKPHSADHWRLKPNYSKYAGRLFRSQADSPDQIYEISPFGQIDLAPSGIFILDAFFEMYVIVGSLAQSQYASFRNALDFAQEYGILAAGMEDRPFVPYATVVLEGCPRDLKSVFRKWTEERSPTTDGGGGAAAASGGLKRGRSLRVVPLTQALQALSGR